MARRHIMESTFRLNLLNPQHAKINEVIKGLNPKIYKSKNQFLIEACEFYIDHYGEDDIPSKEEKRYEQFVTRDEIEKIKKEIEYSAMSEARKEVIAKTFHCNFSKYVNGVRLNYAVAALENTMDSITNICLDCGFESQRTFNRVFKDKIQDYTKRVQKKDGTQ